jgi:hypothetical protein
MKCRFIQIGTTLLIAILCASCKTYYIPIESFKDQMKDIKCVDKENKPFELKNSPSIEVRITDKNNKRTYLYFDQMYVQDSILKGDGSRFIYYPKQIPLKNIKLIEIQDGHKKFKYVDKNNNR